MVVDKVICRESRDEILNALTYNQRVVAVLLEAGYTQQEIGDALGIHQTSVSERLRWARARAERKLAELYPLK